MARDPTANTRDDDADLMSDEVTDEAREDLQSSLAGDESEMSDFT